MGGSPRTDTPYDRRLAQNRDRPPHDASQGATPMAGMTSKPWDGSAARFTPAQWRASCLIDTGAGDPDTKGRYKLPVQEPDGTPNTNAMHAAAAVLAGGMGGVQASPQAKKAAAKKLVRLYGQANETPPPSLKNMAS